jgi:pilus assembly protein CpaF
MSLLRRVERAQQALASPGTGELVPVMAPPPLLPPQPRTPAREALLHEIRTRLVGEVINAFDTLLDDKATDIRGKIEGIVDRTLAANGYAVTRDERLRLVDEMADDVTGFGPLEPLLHDESITEVMVNGPSHVYIERNGKI